LDVKISTCICCGKEETPTFLIPSHIGSLRACAVCLNRVGSEELAMEADRLLTDFYMGQRPKPVCPVCKTPLILYPDGSTPMWCARCEEERKAIVRQNA
jgi:LSD1 subclass zinc finger protein